MALATFGSRLGWFVFGVVFAVVAAFAGGYFYLKDGHPPVAAADPAFPMEAQIVHVPLGARIARELQTPPFANDEAGAEAGARVYTAECASCHGRPGYDVPSAKWMYPRAPQLWKAHGSKGVVGVSDDEPGETYWKVKNGIRLTGMPAYGHILSDTQMWQVSLLLKSADKPLSLALAALLAQPAGTGQAAAQ